ncbi:MAG: hypothetical protein SGILL_008211 [Bacillariaceae sp.]
MMSAVSTVSGTSFSYDIPAYPDVPETTLSWPAYPAIPHVPDCDIHVGPSSSFSDTLVVDHCLLDCHGHAIRGHGTDPAVVVRNNGILYNCPIDVEQHSTGVKCDDGNCFLLDVSCHGDKNFNECVLVKNHAENVVIAGLTAKDSNGKFGVQALEAYDANVFIIASEIKNQRNDGVKAVRINNLVTAFLKSTYNEGDGIDAYLVNHFVVLLASEFSYNYDEGIDATRPEKLLIAASEAKNNKHNGLEASGSSGDYINIIGSYFDNNGFGAPQGDQYKKERNGMYIEGTEKVDIWSTRAEYNKGDGYFLKTTKYVNLYDSYAAYNQADGIDLRHIHEAKLDSVNAYQNYLTGLRAVGNGEIYVEHNSNFYENGQTPASFEANNLAGINIKNMQKAYIDETSSYDNHGDGVVLKNVADVDIKYSYAERNGDDGFDIETATYVDISYETYAANNGENGFRLKDIGELKIDEDVKSYGNHGRGFDLRDVDHAEIYKTKSYNNGKDGFYALEVQYFSVQESESVNNEKDGFFMDNGNINAQVNFHNVIACNNHDDGMDFQEGFDDGTLFFDPSDQIFSCDNRQLDLQFDGVIDVNIGSTSDLVGPTPSNRRRATVFADITADTCADKNGDENIQECKDLEIAPCDHFVCPSY